MRDGRRAGARRVRARASVASSLPAPARRPTEVEAARRLFDPDVLTLGFARRFATYKRPNLLLHDPERLLRLLTHRSDRCN